MKNTSTLQERMNSAGALELKPGEEVSMTREEALKRLGLPSEKGMKKKKLEETFNKTKDGQ